MEKELGVRGDKVAQFQLQVNFLVPEDFKLDSQESAVIQKKNSRWGIIGDSPIDIKGMRGNVKITMRQRDDEGDAVACSVVIAGHVKGGDIISASLRIRIIT